MKDGVYLSADALSRVEKAYKSVAVMPPKERLDFFLAQKEITWKHAASRFDAFYYSLYLLNITKAAKLEVEAPPGDDLAKLYDLRTMLEITVPSHDPAKYPFAKTLLDEYLVADLLAFTDNIKRLIPYPTRVETVGLGCVWFDFGVYGTAEGFNPKVDLPFLDRKMIGAAPEQTAHRAWRAVKKNYHVAAIELSPALGPK